LSRQWQGWQRRRRRLAESMRLSTTASLGKEPAEVAAKRRAREVYEAAPLGVIEELRDELDECVPAFVFRIIMSAGSLWRQER
jgi:hypothetical protein